MAEKNIVRMTVEEFLAWDPGDGQRYELVDGLPRMMTGARRIHDKVVVNGLIALGGKLRGRDCRPYTDDLGVRIPGGNLLRPDILVDCDPGNDDDLSAGRPVLIVEVLSPSNSKDLLPKLIRYKSVRSIDYILVLEADRAAATFYERIDEKAWNEAILIGTDTRIPLSALGIELLLGDFYDGVL